MAADATKLESVNQMLTTAGSVRTSSLSSARVDVITAEQILDEVDRSVQLEGWHFNRQHNQTFSPNASNEIELTDDIFEVHQSSGEDSPTRRIPTHPTDYAKRGGKLYNAETDSFTFEADVKLNVIRRVAFEDLPQYARDFITARAASRFYKVQRGKRSDDAREEELRARATLMQAEARSAQHNMFQGPSTSWPHYYRR